MPSKTDFVRRQLNEQTKPIQMPRRLRAPFFFGCGRGDVRGHESWGVRWLLYAFVSHFVSRAPEKGAKTVPIGPFREFGGEHKSVAVQAIPLETKGLMMISSQVPLTTQPAFRRWSNEMVRAAGLEPATPSV